MLLIYLLNVQLFYYAVLISYNLNLLQIFIYIAMYNQIFIYLFIIGYDIFEWINACLPTMIE